MGQEVARAQVPHENLQSIRIGRLIALQKESGGVRGIVVAGDIVRSHCQYGPCVRDFHWTRAGSECIAHVHLFRRDWGLISRIGGRMMMVQCTTCSKAKACYFG